MTINNGPLADIAFLLLIFFLVVSTLQMDHGITSKLSPEDGGKAEKNLWHTEVWINRDGLAVVNGEQVTHSRLARELRDQFNETEGIKNAIHLKTEREVDYALFIQAMDACKESFDLFHRELALATFEMELHQLTRGQQEQFLDAHPVALIEDVMNLDH